MSIVNRHHSSSTCSEDSTNIESELLDRSHEAAAAVIHSSTAAAATTSAAAVAASSRQFCSATTGAVVIAMITAVILLMFRIQIMTAVAQYQHDHVYHDAAIADGLTWDYRWMKRYSSSTDDLRLKCDVSEVVFIGDSMTEFWHREGAAVWSGVWERSYSAINLGIGGDRTQQLLWRLKHDHGQKCPSVKVVVLLIGTNNSEQNNANNTATAVIGIVHLLQESYSKATVLIISIIPRNNWQLLAVNQEVTEMMKAATAAAAVAAMQFVDLRSLFLTQSLEQVTAQANNTHAAFDISTVPINSTLFIDGLHLSVAGYQLYSDALRPIVDQLIAK